MYVLEFPMAEIPMLREWFHITSFLSGLWEGNSDITDPDFSPVRFA